MSKALDANFQGLLSALQQNKAKVALDSTKDELDRITAESGNNINHHRKKFLFRVMNYSFQPGLVTVVSTLGNGGTLTAGTDNVSVQLNFDRPVTVTGSPQIKLTLDNANNQVAGLASGSGSKVLTFNYVTLADDVAAKGVKSTDSNVDLNGGTMVDPDGNPVGLAFADPINWSTIVI